MNILKIMNILKRIKHPQAIDLGLPSGTKWASCNIGANKPEESGVFYAWGETKEKTMYNAGTYIHLGHDIGKDIAGTEYDVAHVVWGDNWKMPTTDQIVELLQNTKSAITQVNGVYGLRLTATNGNSIFLPAAGYSGNFGLSFGIVGNYWSSKSESDGHYYAYFLYFNPDRVGWRTELRDRGCSIRPVTN